MDADGVQLNDLAPPPGVAPLFSREFTQDPGPTHDWLRSTAPVAEVRLPRGVTVWLITRYAEARQALTDPRVSKDAHHLDPAISPREVGLPGKLQLGLGHHMVSADGPDHARLRLNRTAVP
jgi:cytochrome P450